MIAVDAAVYDKSGKPVTNLTAADFVITEDGKTQTVQTIYLVSSDPNFVKQGATASATQAGAGASELQAGTAGPVHRELRARVMVFVFDLTHLSADGYKRSRDAVEGFLKDGASSADLVGVVANGLMLNNKIDTDKAALLKAMGTMKGPNLSRYAEMRAFPRLIDESEAIAVARMNKETTNRVMQRACGERPDECNGRAGDEIVREQLEAKAAHIAAETQRDSVLSLSALLTLANGLGRLPGTKNVIILSEGFYTGELREALKGVVTLAARNNVRFSTMDARGLSRDPRMQNLMNEQPLTGAGDLSTVSTDENADVLSSLAIDTGGEVIMNHNSLRSSVDLVAAQAGTYYVLGYAPTRTMDGQYHGISVKVTRPDVTIRARKGYVAIAPSLPTSAVPSTPPTSASPSTPPTSAAPALPTSVLPSTLPTSVLLPTLPTSDLSLDPTSVPSGAPRFRPNSDKNVASLTRVAPGAGTSDTQALANAGWDAYALGDVATAREKLSAAVKTGTAAPWVSYALGFANYALGQYDAAVAAWSSVRAGVPEFMPVYFDLADAYISLGRSSDALSTLRDAAKRWPVESEPQNALGTLLVKRGAVDEAIDVFTRITTAKPADSLGFFNLARAFHIRYLRLQQNVANAKLPSRNAIGEDDRQKAIAGYKRYLTLGGPFEKEAKDAIALLDWK